MTQQGFKTVDVLRLEVEVEPTGPYNLLPSAAGNYGAWGWITPVANSVIEGSGSALSYSGPAASYFTSDNMPVTPGHYAAARWTLPPPLGTSGGYSCRFEWLDAAGVFISFSTASAVYGTPGNYTLTARQAPANARFMRLRVDLAASATFILFVGVCVATASTAAAIDAAIGTVALTGGTNWRNVIGPSSNIKVTRETLNLGVLEAEILDSTLDPATTPDLRPGREVRLTTIDGGGVWQTLFVGKADVLEVDYDAKRMPPRPPRVKILATDRTSRLAAASRSQGTGKLDDLPAILEGAGIPWNVNGNTSHVKTWTPFGNNDNATALDQVALTRDTVLGSAWVSREGVLFARDHVDDPAIANPGAEVNTSGWTPGTGTALVRATVAPKVGVGHFQLTRTGALTNLSMTTPVGVAGMPVVGGIMLTAKASFRAAAVAGRLCQMVWSFWDATGNTVNYDSNLYPASLSNVNSTTTGYTESTYTIRVPGKARFAALALYVTGTASGEVHYIDDVSIVAPIEATLTEPNYSALDIGFRSTDVINSVNVEVLTYDAAAGRTTPVVFGPYEDAVSVAQWQRRAPAKPFTVHGIPATEVAASNYAAKILARNATPTVTVRGLTLPMRDATDRVQALRDLGDRVRVRHVGKGIDQTLRVSRVVHTITAEPKKWTVSLGFESTTGVAAPQRTPAPGVAPLADVAPTGLAYAAGWSAYGAASALDGRASREDGWVTLEGLVKGGASGSLMFVLPVGWRPENRLIYAQPIGDPIQTGRIDVWPDGNVTHSGGPSGTWPTGYVSLAGIRFKAYQ
jgi:hypothetical protein